MFVSLHDRAYRAAQNTVRRLANGALVVKEPGRATFAHVGAAAGPCAELELHDRAAITDFMLRGDVGFAEAYRRGLWSSPDLVALLKYACANADGLDRYLSGHAVMRQLVRLAYFLRGNSVAGSRRNVHAHYDLSAAFFALWLDPTMAYSSAQFSHPDEPLEVAQRNKLDAVLAALSSSPGRVLEIGCGWGSFIEHAVRRAGHHVTGITISAEQHAFARRRLEAFGSQVDLSLTDYRHQGGRFDSVVAIEMFEAVGERYWPIFFQKLASLVSPRGRAVLQTIIVRDCDFEKYRAGIDIFRSLVFPGGMLSSLSRFSAEAHRAGLKIAELQTFGPHYARTAERWLAAFDDSRAEIGHLGFDEPFIRLWRFYLASCVAAFSCGKIDVMRVALRHA